MQEFSDHYKVLNQKQREELYTYTFDVQAITTMDVGYILFGEDYKRGKLLVHLNHEHRMAGVDCKGQLADHLPNMLRLINKLTDETLKSEMAIRLIIPAVQKINKDFAPETIQKKQKIYKKHQNALLENPVSHSRLYYLLFEALLKSLKNDFATSHFAAAKKAVNYETDFQTELKNSNL
ncbi:MAG: hypothetical protein U5L09_20580 [Bacteroidales bacterium]|nr:hypothetical protein [Bacteroidales bacterium]